MSQITPRILRFLIVFLIPRRSTYFIGMVLVRFSRWIRRFFRKSDSDKTNNSVALVKNAMGSVKMELDVNSYMGGSIFWSGYHHINEIIFLDNFLTSAMTFVDIGANQGEFTLFAASKLKRGRVIAFEPVSKQYSSLRKNIELNGFLNVETYQFGLSDKEGTFPVYTSISENNHHGKNEGLSSLYKSEVQDTFEEEIQLKIFDIYFKEQLERIDFIKIDIEGAELYALKGMESHIQKYKPVILIEMGEEAFNSAGYSIDDVLEFMRGHGYSLYSLNRGELRRQVEAFADWGNYIFKVDSTVK